MVQTTFTKQKRELEKAMGWIEKIRAQEVRQCWYNERDELQEEIRETYVDYPPEVRRSKSRSMKLIPKGAVTIQSSMN
jgi:hypothetical protein